MVIASHLCYMREKKDCHGGFASVYVWLCTIYVRLYYPYIEPEVHAGCLLAAGLAVMS